ncbi:DUF5665 domain-containing protein [Kyrpidia sp.]|uniref:DUF5665 domain-containing protein n=1 Tax=Kyrpidia sp. TaxID=2073077 RepID=UPI002585C1F6|nr:DUF5665 domain-containing protein [Kyrpidia sp.]
MRIRVGVAGTGRGREGDHRFGMGHRGETPSEGRGERSGAVGPPPGGGPKVPQCGKGVGTGSPDPISRHPLGANATGSRGDGDGNREGRGGSGGPEREGEATRRVAETAARIEEPLRTLAAYLERGNFAEYVYMVTRPSRLIWINLISGLSRGVGIGVGFTLIAALLVYLLQALAVYNLPVIGGFIAELVKIVQAQLHTPRVP